jgi:hypothetical protein|tara:strand:+ start:491 stop:1645 length:1155 start_codon:yes stop_codon:yes gene_type:complete
MDRKFTAYIDECGNSGFDFESSGVSNFYIISSVIIKPEKIIKVKNEAEEIRKKYFQTGEIKSKGVGDDDKRRLKILKKISELDFKIYAYLIDKRKLFSEGFRHNNNLYKFIHNLIDSDLFITYPDLFIIADNYGDEEFRETLKKYVRDKFPIDLFHDNQLDFDESKDNVLVQLADFISGTLGKCFDKNKSTRRDEFLNIITDKIIDIKRFPREFDEYTHLDYSFNSDFDYKISKLSVNLSLRFIKNNKGSKCQQIKDQIACLNRLIFVFNNINKHTYTSADSLINYLESIKPKGRSRQYLRNNVISKLRDKDLLISSTSRGYKLPSSKKDLNNFINHMNSKIHPMIDRVLKCNSQIMRLSMNEINLLKQDEFKYLKIIFENLKF